MKVYDKSRRMDETLTCVIEIKCPVWCAHVQGMDMDMRIPQNRCKPQRRKEEKELGQTV